MHGQATVTGLSAPRRLELAMFVTYVLSRIRAYFRYRETLRELGQLTDRELADIGLERWELQSVARIQSGV
jgi:uncharacterized protein YjiS (DUF1127 family)